MLIFFYLAVLITGMYWAYKILAPEMRKPPVVYKAASVVKASNVVQVDQPVNRVEKIESLLAEKSKNILILQAELKVFYAQIRDFDKVKSVLEEEIHRLREQNRIFRSELGLPATQPKENSIT